MRIQYVITPELRIRLKEPFGILIKGSFDETMCKMKELVEEEKPSRIISVGDVVSRNLHGHGINPKLTIIDNKSLRSQSMPETVRVKRTVYVTNPQGTITEDAVIAIKEAIDADEHTHIIVDGEEDLLTLIAVLYAPDKTLVVYGQPHKGIVVVKVNPQKKAQIEEFLKTMKPLEKLNKKKPV